MQLTSTGVTTILRVVKRRLPVQLVHVISSTVLHFNLASLATTFRLPVIYITDFTCHLTIVASWVRTISTAAPSNNTFERHAIPNSSLETVPTSYQMVVIASIIRWQCVSLGAVCCIENCVI